jgi:hypothetical protein
MQRLLEDVNLDSVEFGPDGTTITFRFLDMSEGKPKASLECIGVTRLDYRNTSNERLAFYIGQVDCQPWTGGFSSEKADTASFGFRNVEGKMMNPPEGILVHVHLEGTVSIDVVCSDYRLSPAVHGQGLRRT